MAASLPYLVAPGSIKTALERIRSAATPDRVTRDFVTTKLQIKGGTGFALIPYLKKIGLVASDGSPTELYKQFRNPSSGGVAIARAVKGGYSALAEVNEYFFDLSDKELLDLIVQVTGLERDNQVAKLTFSTLKILKSFANFEAKADVEETPPNLGDQSSSAAQIHQLPATSRGQVGLNLAYTINLNLPATSDQAVFNAIFRSLKEHLFSDGQ
jgi:hypothetical protein